ncbi:hypothetical protein SY94_4776 [Agrobacterium tumefaciens]|nr:hypothetical protein SY94_4776 [Agrobacterium tumefaciens]
MNSRTWRADGECRLLMRTGEEMPGWINVLGLGK